MSGTTASTSRKQSSAQREEIIRRHGFYALTFTQEELRHLESEPEARPEFKLLRTKILRLAKLTPLRTINDKELDTLIKLVRVVAALDGMERTGVMSRKVDAAFGADLDVLDELDPQDLRAE